MLAYLRWINPTHLSDEWTLMASTFAESPDASVRAYGEQLLDGIFHLMHSLGIWLGDAPDVREPIISTDGRVSFLNAPTLGMFVPTATHWEHVRAGEVVGEIINPLTGKSTPVASPVDGVLFTLREYPLVYEGSLLARVLGREEAQA